MYMNLDKKFVDDNLSKWNKDAIEEFKDMEGKENNYLFSDEYEGSVDQIKEDSISIIIDHPKLGFISTEIKMDKDDMLSLLEMAVKKMNKFKTLLESLK